MNVTKKTSGGGLLHLADTLEEAARMLRDTVAQLGGGAVAAPAPRPVASAAKAPSSGKAKAPQPDGARACAIIDCGKPSRTKGYCAAHYQKLRSLEKTKRRPDAWADNAGPNSVKDVVLPRGRAASKALAESNTTSGV
ncbi:cell wall protein [Corallococcus sp. bb12-1]|uniref:cell wall protein n=1 Tax=Corallococcus sp. bb12-1 TaxID=2996784 RepID=UPI003B6403B8